MGLVAIAVGTIPFLAYLGILPTRPPQPGDAPMWMGGAIGLAFFLAGVVVIIRTFAGASDSDSELPGAAPRPLRALYDLLRLPIPILLAAMFTWIAFGPGERHFSMSVGSGGSGVAMAGGETMGRVAFGVVALLGWVIVGFGLLAMLRRWLGQR